MKRDSQVKKKSLYTDTLYNEKVTSRKHAYITLTPLNPTFI